MAGGSPQGMASHDDSGTAMALPLMLEGKFDFRTFSKGPFGEQLDPFGRPVNLVMDKIDRIREADRYTFFIS